MDLLTLDTSAASEQGEKMEVQHPATGAVLTQTDGAAVTIVLAGQDSERFKKADRKISNRRLATTAAGRRVTLTSESIEADNLERLVACTISWSGVGFGGVDKECTPDNVREVYKRLPWLREQAETFIQDRANFLKASPAS